LFTVLRCLAAWLDGELGLSRRWSASAAICTVALLCSYWKLPYHGLASAPENRQYAQAIEDVYQKLRNHLPQGPRTRVVVTTIGHLNEVVLCWRFLMDQAEAPIVRNLAHSRSVDHYLPWLATTDIFVIPESGMKSLLVYEQFPSAAVQDKLLEHFAGEARFHQFAAVPTPSGKRVLLFERRQPFASQSSVGLP
jgi:hypothetical protein